MSREQLAEAFMQAIKAAVKSWESGKLPAYTTLQLIRAMLAIGE